MEIVAQVEDTVGPAQVVLVPALLMLPSKGEHYFHENLNYMSVTAQTASHNRNWVDFEKYNHWEGAEGSDWAEMLELNCILMWE